MTIEVRADGLLDTVTVVAKHEEQLVATHVNLLVVVESDALFSGRAALRKAKQIAALVDQLVPDLLPEEDVHIQNVHAKSSGGLLGRSSSATYELRFVCRELENVPDVLGIVTSAKGVTLRSMSWQYDESDDALDRRLEAALTKARTRAGRVASALGVRLLGVHKFHEVGRQVPAAEVTFASSEMPARRRSTGPPLDTGVEFRNERSVATTVEVHFHVSRFES